MSGNGKHFPAGADLKWINAVRRSSADENLRVSRATAEAVQRLNVAPVPTVALVHGGCFGGGTGMIAACDIVLAADNAQFSIAEVRWGLHASIIIPQLADAIGARQLRRYALTGERFGPQDACRIGLAHMMVRQRSRARARASSIICWRRPGATRDKAGIELGWADLRERFQRLLKAIRPSAFGRSAEGSRRSPRSALGWSQG